MTGRHPLVTAPTVKASPASGSGGVSDDVYVDGYAVVPVFIV